MKGNLLKVQEDTFFIIPTQLTPSLVMLISSTQPDGAGGVVTASVLNAATVWAMPIVTENKASSTLAIPKIMTPQKV